MPTVTRRMYNHRGSQDGKVWADSGWLKYFHGDTAHGITPGEYIIFRMPLTVPKGATVSLAEFSVEYGQKDAAALPQSATYTVGMESYSPEMPTGTDVVIGPSGTYPPLPRLKAANATTVTINYTSNTPGADYLTVDVTAMVQEIVASDVYEVGQPVSVFLLMTAEVGDLSPHSADNAFTSRKPQLDVTYTYDIDTDDRRWDINETPNQTFELDLEMVNMGTAFGEYVTGQTAVLSTEQAHSGTKSLKVISGPTGGSAGFGAQFGFNLQEAGRDYTFSGWVWVPSSLPRGIDCSFLFQGYSGDRVNLRDQWVPFSTAAIPSSGYGGLFGVANMTGPTDAAYYFYLDDLCITATDMPFKQRPFGGYSTDTNLIKHDWPRGSDYLKGTSVRTSRARSQVHTGGSMKPRTGWVLGADGLWIRADPERQSLTWDEIEAGGKTWDQLKATAKTWDELEAVETI